MRVIQYSIEKERSMICAYSEERLNFEPHDWRKDFKKDLSIAIKELVPNGDVFKAELVTKVDKDVVEYIASKDHYSVEMIESFFRNNKIAVLPKRNIIQKYRKVFDL